MAGSSTSSLGEAAKRYAAAAFELALDAGDVDGVEAGLNALSRTIAGDAGLARALASPVHRTEDKQAVVAALAARLGLADLAGRVAGVAAANRRAGDLRAIASAFAERAARHRGATRVTARVAHALTDDQKLALESTVSKAIGRAVSVDVEIDPALIGGLQVRMGSRLVDASIRTKLNALTNVMKGA